MPAEIWSLLQERVKLKRGKEVSVTELQNIARSSLYPIKLAPALFPVSVTGEGEGSKGVMTFSVMAWSVGQVRGAVCS